MWDLIVSVPDHCLSFYFLSTFSLLFFSDLLEVYCQEFVYIIYL